MKKITKVSLICLTTFATITTIAATVIAARVSSPKFKLKQGIQKVINLSKEKKDWTEEEKEQIKKILEEANQTLNNQEKNNDDFKDALNTLESHSQPILKKH
ncbi:hypothetical protein [Metamycoplasma alkalescens]|uniref:Uncharacterized protein n=3 Tax=Metamycoplasma alkalescens TaxID=45363 RepID=N9UAF6_9BACT|nr:hypothetical protein [Metamycoplasma alkalescens]ENY53681.1 Hypothetical protein, predicted transmembrane protein [Metamycoplasma alkalescens 14918]PYF43084.1 hypothetical protein BCF88_1056 [Metamycoplasma alkalescens]